MTSIWVLTIAIFILMTYFVYKLYNKYVNGEKAPKKKMWNLWGIGTAHWEGILIASSALPIVVVLILKWTNVLPF